MQMVKLYGMVSVSILRNHLPAVTVFLLKVKPLENMDDRTVMTDEELCLVMQTDSPGTHADLKQVTYVSKYKYNHWLYFLSINTKRHKQDQSWFADKHYRYVDLVQYNYMLPVICKSMGCQNCTTQLCKFPDHAPFWKWHVTCQWLELCDRNSHHTLNTYM